MNASGRTTTVPLLAVLAAAAWLSLAALPMEAAATDPSVACAATKLKLAGKYAACRTFAEASATDGSAPDFSRCDQKLNDMWSKVETRYGLDCPNSGDLSAIRDELASCIDEGAATITNSRWYVDFYVSGEPLSYGSLGFEVDYSNASGAFSGSGYSVVCSHENGPELFVAFDDSPARKLQVAMVSQYEGFSVNRTLVTCAFDSLSRVPDPDDFAVVVIDAADLDAHPLNSTQVVVSSIHP